MNRSNVLTLINRATELSDSIVVPLSVAGNVSVCEGKIEYPVYFDRGRNQIRSSGFGKLHFRGMRLLVGRRWGEQSIQLSVLQALRAAVSSNLGVNKEFHRLLTPSAVDSPDEYLAQLADRTVLARFVKEINVNRAQLILDSKGVLVMPRSTRSKRVVLFANTEDLRCCVFGTTRRKRRAKRAG